MQAELVEEALARVLLVFTRLAQSRRLNSETDSVEAFVKTSVRNACTDVFSEQKRALGNATGPVRDSERPEVEIADPRGEHVTMTCAVTDLLLRLAKDPDDGWKKATVLRLFYGEDWSTREIAEYFRVTERTVFRWKRDGLKYVRALAEDESIPSGRAKRKPTSFLISEATTHERIALPVDSGMVSAAGT